MMPEFLLPIVVTVLRMSVPAGSESVFQMGCIFVGLPFSSVA